MNVIMIAAGIALAGTGASWWMLRRITRSRATAEDLEAWLDINWQSSRPIQRLLDPSEFEFLRLRGMKEQRIRQLRAKRRRLFRMYLRRLTHEFNTVHGLLRMAMVDANADRADLATELGRQRLLFYRHLVVVELRLAVDALGFDSTPTLDLIRPLERLHLEFANLVPAAAGAQA